MSTIEIQFDKKIDNSRVIREVDLRCRVDYICTTLLGAVFGIGILFYASQQFQWIQYGYEIEEAQRTIDELTEVGRMLRIEKQRLANPQRIEQIARGELGMVGAGPDQYVSPGQDFLRSEQESSTTLVALGKESRLGP